MFTLLAQSTAKPIGKICGAGLGPFGAICDWTGKTPGEKLGSAASAIVGFLTVCASLFFLFQFIIGGLQWLMAGGEKTAISNAQQKLTNAFLGLLLVVAAISISKLLSVFLGFDILNPGSFLEAIKFR